MEAPFYNHTTLVYKQIVSPSLLFHVNGASEPAMLFLRRKGETTRTEREKLDGPQSFALMSS